jgi:hypothetical protein
VFKIYVRFNLLRKYPRKYDKQRLRTIDEGSQVYLGHEGNIGKYRESYEKISEKGQIFDVHPT